MRRCGEEMWRRDVARRCGTEVWHGDVAKSLCHACVGAIFYYPATCGPMAHGSSGIALNNDLILFQTDITGSPEDRS